MAMTKANKTKLRKQLMATIDSDDMQQVDKVERYISLVELDEMLEADIKKEGTSTEIINGAQRYVKTNPAIAERLKISTSLLALEKSMGLDYQTQAKQAKAADPEPMKVTETKASASKIRQLRPSVSDLI